MLCWLWDLQKSTMHTTKETKRYFWTRIEEETMDSLEE